MSSTEQRYYVASSPFGKEIVTFDCETHILKTWRVTKNEETISTNFECTLREEIGIKTEGINWSLAISDADPDGNTLIALSCFNLNKANDNKRIDVVTDDEIDVRSNSNEKNAIDIAIKTLNSIQIYSTRVISTSGNEVWHRVKKFYGFLQFFQGNMLLISNHLGIMRGLCIDNCLDINYLTNLYRGNISERRSKLKNINIYEKYWKPIYIIEKPSYMDLGPGKRRSKLKYVKVYEKYFNTTCMIEKPLYIYQELNSPRTFNKHFKKHVINYHKQSESCDKEEKKFYEILGYPNDFIETLEVMNEEEQLSLIQNCIVCGKLFIRNEEKNIEMYNLLSRNMEMLYHHSNFQTEFINIFAISKNAKLLAVTINDNSVALYLNENSLNIAKKNFTSPGKLTYMAFFNDDEKLLILKEDEIQNHLIIWNIFDDSETIYLIDKNAQIIDLFGTMAFINNPDDIQLLDEENLKRLEMKNDNKSEELNLSEKITDDIFDTEPWFYSGHHQTSYWLDDDKTTRISFGFYTIQIWKNNELIHIWSAKYDGDHYYDLSSEIPTPNIELLDISSNHSRNIAAKFKCVDIEYEFQVNRLVDYVFTRDHAMGAYNTLIFFYKLKLSEISYKQLKMEEFIEKTKIILYNIIINKPDLWRALEVRYNLMEDLIHNKSNEIIKFILNQDKKLHIPQLYEWNGNKKSNYELLITLEDDNIEILQLLINYYSSNAMENSGWMFALTHALSKINRKFPEYILKLFEHPVFYQKQIHLTKFRIRSTLASNPSYNIFIVDTRLPLLTKEDFLNPPSYKNSHTEYSNNNVKIHMIPLPDFNKYIEIHGYKKTVRSPFYDLMSQKPSNLIYMNPTIEAIINFHWNTNVFRKTIPKLISYGLYFIIINAHFLLASFYTEYKALVKTNRIGSFLAVIQIFRYIHFAGSETRRTLYFHLFNIFNQSLISTTLALFDNFDSSIVIILITLTMFSLWVEFFLFLRIIPVVGEYILIIAFLVSKVIPYFLTMMIMILGFSCSMFIIFSNAAILGIKSKEDEYSFGNDTNNIILKHQNDSPNFLETLEMVYLWLFGNWDDIRNWSYIPIKILAILASFFLIIIMQNIFIALMTEAISKASNYSIIASLKSRADYISQLNHYYYSSICCIWSYFYLSTESSFNFRFYHFPTFNSTYNRHIFYIINRDNIKNWITIDNSDDGSDLNKAAIATASNASNNELIEKISGKQLTLENEVQKLNEKFDKLLELLNKK